MSYYIGKNSARYTLQGAVTLLESLGIRVRFGKVVRKGFENSLGLTECRPCDRSSPFDRKYKNEYYVTIDNDLSLEEQKFVLSHEIAHIVLGHLVGDQIESDYNISHEQQEFEAEALGLMLCNFMFGFISDGSNEQNEYAAHGLIEISNKSSSTVVANNSLCTESVDTSEKIKNIIEDDMECISISLSEIQAAAKSTYSYLDHLICGAENANMKNFLYMLNVIDDISKTAENSLLEVMNKLYKISYGMEEAV